MMMVDVAGSMVLTHDIETRNRTMPSDMDHPAADQVTLGKRLAGELAIQLDFQADHVCSEIPRGMRHTIEQLGGFVRTWPDRMWQGKWS
jgi:hypothetical protein